MLTLRVVILAMVSLDSTGTKAGEAGHVSSLEGLLTPGVWCGVKHTLGSKVAPSFASVTLHKSNRLLETQCLHLSNGVTVLTSQVAPECLAPSAALWIIVPSSA